MKPLDLILVAALGAGVAAYLALPAGAPERNLEYLPDMAYSPASKAYAANPLFPDGKVLQTPPSGTIRRGAPARFPYAATPVDALRAGAELRNPYATENLEAYTRGGVVYGRFCIPCHGGGGRGDGPVTLKGFPAPPPFASERTLKMADGQMYHAITLGGEKKMPAYGLQVAPGDRWKVILYVRGLQRSALAQLQPATPAAAAPPQADQAAPPPARPQGEVKP